MTAITEINPNNGACTLQGKVLMAMAYGPEYFGYLWSEKPTFPLKMLCEQCGATLVAIKIPKQGGTPMESFTYQHPDKTGPGVGGVPSKKAKIRELSSAGK